MFSSSYSPFWKYNRTPYYPAVLWISFKSDKFHSSTSISIHTVCTYTYNSIVIVIFPLCTWLSPKICYFNRVDIGVGTFTNGRWYSLVISMSVYIFPNITEYIQLQIPLSVFSKLYNHPVQKRSRYFFEKQCTSCNKIDWFCNNDSAFIFCSWY